MKRIILASQSPRRKQLLKQIGLQFDVIVSGVDEKLNPRFKPRKQAEVLSLQKAQSIAEKLKNGLVIGADTIVCVDNDVIGKPKDESDAKRMLKKLSGRTHSVITGFTLIDTESKKHITKSVETKLWFRKLNDRDIQSFIKKEKPFDKAGAYAIQELAAIFVVRIEGDYFNIVGLPLYELAKQLRKFGISVL